MSHHIRFEGRLDLIKYVCSVQLTVSGNSQFKNEVNLHERDRDLTYTCAK